MGIVSKGKLNNKKHKEENTQSTGDSKKNKNSTEKSINMKKHIEKLCSSGSIK